LVFLIDEKIILNSNRTIGAIGQNFVEGKNPFQRLGAKQNNALGEQRGQTKED
jgi:hypothetical protein